ncbi:oxidoreductase [Vreelandella rituensis]|uniref:Oxidoreductase n=2 Tax=Vreelandella rituensis TaxID=2282306 RepID=A0A368U122_9GAMM|nr:oxidoreductase [Halomonas rituensis]
MGCVIPWAPLHAENKLGLPLPIGPVILMVSGDISVTNVGDEAQFDLAMLGAMPFHGFETGTPWTETSGYYSGPLLRNLLEMLDAKGEQVYVKALNDYEATLPIADLYNYDVLLAIRRGGELMPIREFGPLWVLYPFDDHAELLGETFRFRSVWQVMHIHVH